MCVCLPLFRALSLFQSHFIAECWQCAANTLLHLCAIWEWIAVDHSVHLHSFTAHERVAIRNSAFGCSRSGVFFPPFSAYSSLIIALCFRFWLMQCKQVRMSEFNSEWSNSNVWAVGVHTHTRAHIHTTYLIQNCDALKQVQKNNIVFMDRLIHLVFCCCCCCLSSTESVAHVFVG